MSKPTVLITGVTGYLGAWQLKKTVECGKYEVRGTTRNVSSKRAKQIMELFPSVKLFACDLLNDEGWEEAFQGVTKFIHTASPHNANPNFDYVTPAVEGTKRVLAFAAKAGVRDVVVTSSLFSVTPGNDIAGKKVTQEMWSVVDDSDPNGYANSKHLSEREVWAWAKENEGVRVNTVCPGFICGPPVLDTCGGTLDWWKMFTSNDAFFNLHFMVSSVEDVAEMHLAALENENQRRLLCAVTMNFFEMVSECAKEFKPMGYTIPTNALPNEGCPPPMANLLEKWDLDNALEKSLLPQRDWRCVKKTCVDMMHKFIQDGHFEKLDGYKPQTQEKPRIDFGGRQRFDFDTMGPRQSPFFESSFYRRPLFDQMRYPQPLVDTMRYPRRFGNTENEARVWISMRYPRERFTGMAYPRPLFDTVRYPQTRFVGTTAYPQMPYGFEQPLPRYQDSYRYKFQ